MPSVNEQNRQNLFIYSIHIYNYTLIQQIPSFPSLPSILSFPSSHLSPSLPYLFLSPISPLSSVSPLPYRVISLPAIVTQLKL